VAKPGDNSGIKYILLATFFFALMNVGVKLLDRIPAHEIVLFRAAVTLFVGYIILRGRKIYPWGNNKKLLLFRGLSGTAALVMYFWTLQNMPLASAVTIQHLSPIFTVLISGLMLREPARYVQWLFLLAAFGGVLMVKGFDPRVTIPELTIGVAAAVFSATAYNFIRMLKDYDHPLVVVFYFPLVTVPIVGVYTVFNWTTPTLVELSILLAVGLATTAAQIYLTRAYQAETASNLSIFNYLGTIYAIIFGLTIFGETIPPLGYAGFTVIIVAVIVSNRFRRASPERGGRNS